MHKRKIYILLTKFYTQSANTLEFIKGHYYTHSSIGLEEDLNTFYSFVNKGFIVEKISRYAKREQPLPCCLYELEVPQAVYSKVKSALEEFIDKKERLKYSKWGVVLSLLFIPHKIEDSYFCSQFIAEVLKKSEAAKLKRCASLYMPEDFKKIKGLKMLFKGNHRTMAEHYGLKQEII